MDYQKCLQFILPWKPSLHFVSDWPRGIVKLKLEYLFSKKILNEVLVSVAVLWFQNAYVFLHLKNWDSYQTYIHFSLVLSRPAPIYSKQARVPATYSF